MKNCGRWEPRKKASELPGKQRLRHKVKHKSREVVLDTIRAHIKEQIAKLESNGKNSFGFPNVTVEGLADKFHFSNGKIDWALHKLNLEGLIGKGYNSPPHDSPRDHFGGFSHGQDSAWLPTRYPLRYKSPEYIFEVDGVPDNPDSPRGSVAIWDEKPKEKLPRYSKRLHRRVA